MLPAFFFSPHKVLLLLDILAPNLIVYNLLKEWKHSWAEYFYTYSHISLNQLVGVAHSFLEIEFQTLDLLDQHLYFNKIPCDL